MRRAAIALLALALTGCGPTATAIRTPTPRPASSSTELPLETGGPTETGAPTPPPVPTYSLAPGAPWQLIPGFPDAGAFEVTSATATPSGFAAVGFAAAPGEDYYGRRQGVVWRSSDGISWQVTVDPSLLNVTPQTLVSVGSDLYLLGQLATCSQTYQQDCTEPPDSGNAVWRSSDGGAWERLPEDPGMRAGLVDGLAAGHDRVIAFGSADDDAGTSTAWVWSGSSWSTTTDLGGLDPIYALCPSATGFVGFSTHYNVDSDTSSLAAATSADGLHFTAVQLPDTSAAPDAEIDVLATNGSNIVGVGYGQNDNGDQIGLALYSADGATWTVAADTDGSFNLGAPLSVAAVTGGYLALGYRPDAQDPSQLAGSAWFSADGRSWRGLAGTGGTFSDVTSSAAGPSIGLLFAVQQVDTENDSLLSTIIPWYAHLDTLLAH